MASPGETRHLSDTHLLKEQKRLNHGSADLWDSYRRHRKRVTGLILQHAAKRLVILGAGNCNDLDLAAITAAYAEVHLVDIDAIALAQGIDRQKASALPNLHCHGGVDVSRLDQQTFTALHPADVVVSAALLSQLIDSTVRQGGGEKGILLIRDGHLRVVSGLLRRGGTALLVTDVVSSDTYPDLRTASVPLADLLPQLLRKGNFFTGCNPFAIAHRLGRDPSFGVENVEVTRPWRWDIGQRSHLVCAIVFRRRRSDQEGRTPPWNSDR